MNIRRTLAAVVSGTGIAVCIPVVSLAATATVVTPSNTQGWTTSAPAENKPGGSVGFTEEFGAPSGFGTGSLKVTTTDGSAKAQYMHPASENTMLNSVNNLAYSTYRSSASTGTANQVAAMNVAIDANGLNTPGGLTTLVFEPVYNTNQGTLVNNTWQNWNAGNDSTWWSSNPIPSAPNRDTFVTLSQIKAANPDAVVLYYGVNQGSGNAGIVSGVDAFTFGNQTYNFETKAVAPTDKDDCKDNGWKNFQTQYKNQGQCVSSVVSHRDDNNKPSVVEQVRSFFGL
jgi:hypothetical protein